MRKQDKLKQLQQLLTGEISLADLMGAEPPIYTIHKTGNNFTFGSMVMNEAEFRNWQSKQHGLTKYFIIDTIQVEQADRANELMNQEYVTRANEWYEAKQ